MSLIIDPYKFAAPSGPTLIGSDTFGGTDAQWTSLIGSDLVSGGTFSFPVGGFDPCFSGFNPTVGLNQALQVTLVAGNDNPNFAQIILRRNNSGAFYALEPNNTYGLSWYYYSGPSASGVSIESASIPGGLANGDVLSFTIDGTGNSTFVRMWKNATGSPLSALNWNGDTTPDVVLGTSSNPGTPIDTNIVGVGLGVFESTAGTTKFDAFSVWQLP